MLQSSYALIEAHHSDLDLLEISFRKLLNLAYSWLRHNTSHDDYKKDYASAFAGDWSVIDRADSRGVRTEPARPGQRATIQIKRKAPPGKVMRPGEAREASRAASERAEGGHVPNS